MTGPDATPLETLLAIRERAHVRRCPTGSLTLRQLLSELHAPSALPGGLQIVRNACTLLRGAQAIVPKVSWLLLRGYVTELRWVIRHARRLALLLFENPKGRERFLRCTGANPVLRAGSQEPGLWCLLWECHPERGLLPAFRGLQLQALLAQFAILRHWQQGNQWGSDSSPANSVLHSLYLRTLAIRHFVMPSYVWTSEYRSTLLRVPVRGTRAEHLSALRRIRATSERNLREGEKQSQILEDTIAIIGLLKCAEHPERIRSYREELDDSEGSADIELGEKSPGASDAPFDSIENASYATDAEIERIDNYDDDDEDKEGTPEQIDYDSDPRVDDTEEGDGQDGSTSIYFVRKWATEELEACSEVGVHPAEVLRTEMFLLSDRRSGGSRHWFARDNQLLSLAWQNLAIEEIALGFEALRRALDIGSVRDLELFALVNTIFARGLTEGRAKSLVVRSDQPSTVDVLTLMLPQAEDAPAQWLVPAVPIPYHDVDKECCRGCRRCVKWFPLPDYWNVSALFRRLIEVKFSSWNGQPIQPFVASREKERGRLSYTQRIKDALMRQDPSLAESLKNRFTLPRLGRVLFQRIYDQTAGNIVPATYATGRTHRCGEVPRFYETPSVSTIQIVERRAVASIHEELAAVGCFLPIALNLKPSNCSGYVGSSLCPHIESLQVFLRQTLDTIVLAYSRFRQSRDIADVIRLHNAYTAYTYVGVTVGTCHRPTDGGVPALETIDEFTGMMSIIDKGLERARLSIAADAAFAQRSEYQNYVDTFDFARYLGKVPERQFFFLGSDGEVLPVTPSTLKVHLPFAANFARHLARTVLSEWCDQGDVRLSPERLNALLGHASEGEEPFGAHSSFNYGAFAEAMRLALGDLLKQMAFRAVTFQGKEIAVHDPAVRRFLGSSSAQSDCH